MAKQSDEAYQQFLIEPWNERKKRFYAVLLLAERYETLPLEWREAVKDELEKNCVGVEVEYYEEI